MNIDVGLQIIIAASVFQNISDNSSGQPLGPSCSKAGWRYPADNRYPVESVNKTNHAIRWIVIDPVDSVIHLSGNLKPGGLISITMQRGHYSSIQCIIIF